MRKINFYMIDPSKTDREALKTKFAQRLKRHNILSYESVAAELFKGLFQYNNESSENDLYCPFPCLSSTKSMYNHAKKIKKTIKEEPGLSLGRCQMILAETFGFKSWNIFIVKVFSHYGEEHKLEIKKQAKSIQNTLREQGNPVKLKFIHNELKNKVIKTTQNNAPFPLSATLILFQIFMIIIA